MVTTRERFNTMAKKGLILILLICGHTRYAFTGKPGKNFYCGECKEKVDSLGKI